MERPITHFVHISTSFFIGDKLCAFYIVVKSSDMALFLNSFTNFYNRSDWCKYNKDLPLSFHHCFIDSPDIVPNILYSDGLKPDLKFTSFCNYIHKLLMY